MREGNKEEQKTISFKDFVDEGYMREVNRMCLHRFGLAMSRLVDDDLNTIGFGPIYDHRDDPEGLIYKEPTTEDGNTKSLNAQKHIKDDVRFKRFGWAIQPIPNVQQVVTDVELFAEVYGSPTPHSDEYREIWQK